MSHFFANKITIDKKEYVVGFVVREDGNGNRFYDHELTKIINPDWLVPGKQHEAAELRTNRDTARNTGIIIEILRDRLGVNDGTAQVLFQKQSPTLNAVGDVEKVINGQVRFNEGEGNYVVELFKTANLSTLAHEMGHIYFLEMLRAVENGFVDESMQKDYGKLCAYVGAKPGVRWTVDQNEKLARAWEIYLREGRAPSSVLEEAFARFRQWLTKIYRELSLLNVELNDEVRGVFDRMLELMQKSKRPPSSTAL